MEKVLYVLAVPVFCVVVYVAARFVFAAYFKSRSEFEKEQRNGKK
jgi:hypothetical protein